MVKTAKLQQLLAQFKHLQQHTTPTQMHALHHVQQLQQQRLASQYQNLFSSPAGQQAYRVFCQRIYHPKTIELLSHQLNEAIRQKVKFERWLSHEMLDTLIHAFEVALQSLRLDLQLSQSIQSLDSEVNALTLHPLYIHTQQLALRQKQLHDLKYLLQQCDHYANSFFIRSALRVAKSTLYRRGFSELYEFLAASFQDFKGQAAMMKILQNVLNEEQKALIELKKVHA